METTRFFDRNQKFKDYRKPYRLGKQIFFNSVGTSRKISQPFRHFKQNLKGQKFL